MSMDKITKEELKNLFGGKALSDDELEMVTGGFDPMCAGVHQAYIDCTEQAQNMFITGEIEYLVFMQRNRICQDNYEAGKTACGY